MPPARFAAHAARQNANVSWHVHAVRKDQFGRTEQFYVEEALREAKRDIVAFGDIVHWGRNFDVTDAELDAFVRLVLRELLKAGAKIVRPTKMDNKHSWHELTEYNTSQIERCVDSLVANSNKFEDQHFAWFAFKVPGIWPHPIYDPRAS